MAEVVLAEGPDEAQAAAKWLQARMIELGAVAGDAISGVAGSVDAAMRSFTLSDGTRLEAWGDNYFALSLRGDSRLIESLAAEYREASANG